MAAAPSKPRNESIRIGAAAELLGAWIDTLRRWEEAGTLPVRRSPGGQRLVDLAALRRLQAERRAKARPRRIVAQSARNRFPGIVTRVTKDRVAAVIEVQAGPHRLVSLITAEAVDELSLKPGVAVVCVVKATNVGLEIPQRARGSS